MAVEEAAQEIRRKEPAFGTDGLEFLVGAGHVGLPGSGGEVMGGASPQGR